VIIDVLIEWSKIDGVVGYKIGGCVFLGLHLVKKKIMGM